MSMVSSKRTRAGGPHGLPSLALNKSFHVLLFLSFAIVAIGLLVATGAVAVHPDVSSEQLIMAVPP